MPTVPLPDDPNLEQLRKQAKDLRDLARADDPGARDLVAAHHPKGAHPVTLTGAQLVIARHHGFSSWARLKRHLEIVERYRRTPDEVEEAADLADELMVLACLRYGGDDAPSRWERAARLLADHPTISRSSIHAAATCADEAAVGALLDGDPTLAQRQGGPYALTGSLGSGEGDQPAHPHGFALASLLLDAGADANDSQALYNRQFAADDRHLVLLLQHGLGRGDGGPWRARLGHTTDSPSELVRRQLWWAIVHGMRDRLRLLVGHGADFHSPFAAPGGRPSWARTSDGRTPAEVAALSGCPELVEWLVQRGATRPTIEGVDGLIAAALAGDRRTVRRLRVHVGGARGQRPALIVWAAARGKRDAIPLLAELGFDVNALGRGDVPMEQAWETALHVVASRGDVELAGVLLGLGADPDIRDGRFDSTPLGWARHFGQQRMTELLEPLTT
jgi:ankyrin repeat protein